MADVVLGARETIMNAKRAPALTGFVTERQVCARKSCQQAVMNAKVGP
jgi:hypothetical protein